MMTQAAALFDPTGLTEILKARLPYLRSDTLRRVADVVNALIVARSTCHSALAPHLPGTSSTAAKLRRVERCLQDEQLGDAEWLHLLLPLLPPGKLILVLDRTNWEHGRHDLNLLVLGVVIAGFTLPLVWMALPHGGSSDMALRQRLVARLLGHLPARRWKVLVGDREFIGADWFSFLRRRKVKRCLRIRVDTLVDGARVDEAFADVQIGQTVGLFDKAYVYGNLMQVVVTRSPSGDLVALATDLPIWETCALYRQRLSIECTFSSMKSRGFGLEDSTMTQPDRLERLFGLLILAWVCCLRVGVWQAEQRPIPIKAHGRKARSVVQYGWDALVVAVRWATPMCQTYFSLLNQPFSAPGAA
ncbi:IS4 family transposase [Deinococcus sp.]|uniref:IS4 family transposase n=1 Tax=Deinococcus sp. TaxID=47478 RepID=UPI0025EA2136|nr:IS4 family transposase [Deinococcus sp.]